MTHVEVRAEQILEQEEPSLVDLTMCDQQQGQSACAGAVSAILRPAYELVALTLPPDQLPDLMLDRRCLLIWQCGAVSGAVDEATSAIGVGGAG